MPELSSSEPPKISDEVVRAFARGATAYKFPVYDERGVDEIARGLCDIEATRAGLVTAYPLLRQQWEVELAEKIADPGQSDRFVGEQLADPAVRFAYRTAVENRCSAAVAEAIAREIEAAPWADEGPYAADASAIARARGALLAGPNGSEVPRAT